MTKYILHGGFNKEKGDVQVNDEFFQEMLKNTAEEVRVLLVYFAEREEMVSLRIEQDKEQFGKNKRKKNLNFRIATEETFVEDCAWADIIYLHGGRTFKLMEVLKKYKNIKNAFSSKIVAGDSAGANALGQFFYSKNSKEIKEIGKGLGILPFKIVAHYKDGVTNPLENVEPNLETLFIKEYEIKVFHL
ncbi:hypothetical protein A2814_01585 [Candidatus Nomurabacteria bacterium RIFCSPHIGHO2_01_FULL_38_19]|uniref:Peptidase n=1 Tax=Candidatus Nomurabacteria bacterium RIFCSPHIGHO2_01_FULL_38_19 TaxID=1801732 RepID=A0A1F6UUS4_9BACT|nr:MAG: hypothetical protein A2814_01585 [Candidatus Nomurabacteria bacterium RIFCSPHIGHO2_01_FULL_38_19]